MEEEAQRLYCDRMILNVLKNRLRDSSKQEEEEKGARAGRGASRPGAREPGQRSTPGSPTHRGRRRNVAPPGPRRESERGPTSPGRRIPSQGPGARPVPARLVAALRRQAFVWDVRRALEVEPHDPSVCAVCEPERASLALDAFIRTRKTQLEAQTLEDRLNTHFFNRDGVCLLGELLRSLPDAARRIREDLGGGGGDARVTATRGRLGNKSGTRLPWRQMRRGGYPDKNTTGTHLPRPCCPFPER